MDGVGIDIGDEDLPLGADGAAEFSLEIDLPFGI